MMTMKSLIIASILLISQQETMTAAFSIGSPVSIQSLLPRATRRYASKEEYQPLDGENRINLKQDLTGDNVGPLIVSLKKSSEPQDDTTETTNDVVKMEKKVAGRKKRVIMGYYATSIASLTYAVLSMLGYVGMEDSPLYPASGHVLAAGLAYILAGAAKNDRLKSDTYKRLNLGLVLYGAVGLSMVGLSSSFRLPIYVIPPLLAFINSIKGYAYGAMGWDKKSGKIISDLTEGTKSTFWGMLTIPKNVKALGYSSATLMMGIWKIEQLVKFVQQALKGANGMIISDISGLYYTATRDIFLLCIATSLARVGRMALFTTVLYTLKDAADRGRLEGTTFIGLNFLSSLTFAAMAADLLGNTFLGLANGSTKFRAACAFFSVFSACNGAASILKKRQEA
jgi:hypothetical protein